MGYQDAHAEIDKAVKSGDGSIIGQYMSDDRKVVRDYANKAFKKLEESKVENNTPVPPEPSKEEMIPVETVDQIVSGREDPDSNPPILKDKWIKMTHEEAMQYQKENRLVGHNPKRGIGLLKEGK